MGQPADIADGSDLAETAVNSVNSSYDGDNSEQTENVEELRKESPVAETETGKDTEGDTETKEKEEEEEEEEEFAPPSPAGTTPTLDLPPKLDIDSPSGEVDKPAPTRGELRRIDTFRQKKIEEQGYPEINAEFRVALTMMQAGVPFVTHHYNGVADSAMYSKVVAGTLRYGRDRLVHILRGDVSGRNGSTGCGGLFGVLGLLTVSCRGPDDPVVDECYAVADLHSVVLGQPVPTQALLRHVPEELLKQSVSLICKETQVRMTFESEEVAQMVAKFLRTVIWHQEQQVLKKSQSQVLKLDFSDEIWHSRRASLTKANSSATVG